jgi:exodeoxyribonuclease VII large subunit
VKQRLREEGLFDEEHKRQIPEFPERIGIVTSPTGAAIQDLLNILNRRFPGLEIVLGPVKVQGEGAAQEIANAVDNFNKFGKVDLLIVGRGGGSLEDLWAFNEEVVARSIFRSKIPVISAVGHEVDFTISDFVSDLRAPTPSAAAELAVPDRIELLNHVNNLKKNMTEICLGKLQSERDHLKILTGSYFFLRTPDIIKENRLRIDELVNKMQLTNQHHINMLFEKTKALEQRVQSLSPDSILKRGYSVCRRTRDGVIVRDAKNLKKEESIIVQFQKGKISGIVEEIQE